MSGSQDVLAFCAGIAGENSTFGEGEKLIFDKVLTNHGDGYDPTCGIFTAPEAGVFVISIETSVSPNGILNLELVVDNEPLAEITVEAPERKMASASRRWVLDLNEDSKVFVRAIKSGEVVGRMHTSFSGWRIGFKSPDAIQEERKEPLYPPQAETIPVEKAMASPSKQKVSVQGKVIREEAIRRVDVKNEKGVAVKNIFIEDSSGECKVALWRTLAEESPRPGDCVIITDLIKNIFRNETSLSSTWTSKITMELLTLEDFQTTFAHHKMYGKKGEWRLNDNFPSKTILFYRLIKPYRCTPWRKVCNEKGHAETRMMADKDLKPESLPNATCTLEMVLSYSPCISCSCLLKDLKKKSKALGKELQITIRFGSFFETYNHKSMSSLVDLVKENVVLKIFDGDPDWMEFFRDVIQITDRPEEQLNKWYAVTQKRERRAREDIDRCILQAIYDCKFGALEESDLYQMTDDPADACKTRKKEREEKEGAGEE